MREREFNEMDEARKQRDIELKLEAAERKISRDLDSINLMRRGLNIKPATINLEWGEKHEN